MSDTMIVGGGASIGSDAGTAVTEPPEQSTGPGSAAPETKEVDGGQPQGEAEGGDPQAGQGRKRWSIQDEVKELRAQRRELREQLQSFGSMRDELAQLREELLRRNQPKDAKTPANFWQDPESVLDAKLEEKLERLQNNMFERFQTTREEDFQREQLRQETVSAAEFIRSQPGYSPQDEEDIIEIIKEKGLARLGPSLAAETAWSLFLQAKGVGDKGLEKRRAAGVQGQPPGTGFGRKTWNRAEFDQAVDMVEKNPHDPKMTELFNELIAAHKEGRVR